MYVMMYIRGLAMKRMERKQVYLEADQNRRLRATLIPILEETDEDVKSIRRVLKEREDLARIIHEEWTESCTGHGSSRINADEI